MPIELRSKLLALADMKLAMQILKWSAFEGAEKVKLNKALYDKTSGTAKFSERD